ncbi:phosphotransferase family protein [Antrihabitans cavernicola]|uniref:Phosphotransferase family protein n=1 Tax=Antrihabitans cavernicola TaxID=2495913 RepID=A0A5A7S112_9NOCA|nr:phosphotransferase family protein [Spelaeibacter cavernicola]KAA0016772.1 phosphotransferase family protein [Spelaeibacter cavernicola]
MSEHALGDGELWRLLADTLGDDAWLHADAKLIAGGKSNLTFELTAGNRSVILRRPPTGNVLPSAHDMGREARVIRALGPTAVPVPEILLEDRTGAVVGAPFYVMSKVEGLIIRDELPTGFADTPAEKTTLTNTLVDTLAAIHTVDRAAAGLEDFGRPHGFMARQLRRWTAQWEASRDGGVSPVDELGKELAPLLPDDGPIGLVHGDFRLDNCMVDSKDPGRITGVLDWEMSTLGDPFADLGMLLFYWRESGDPIPALTPAVTALPGFPGREHVAQRYAAQTGADLATLDVYRAFAHFKFAVIAQGIAARVASGAMAGQDFGDLSAEVESTAVAGLEILRQH